jgi:hypothetical protein
MFSGKAGCLQWLESARREVVETSSVVPVCLYNEWYIAVCSYNEWYKAHRWFIDPHNRHIWSTLQTHMIHIADTLGHTLQTYLTHTADPRNPHCWTHPPTLHCTADPSAPSHTSEEGSLRSVKNKGRNWSSACGGSSSNVSEREEIISW